MKKVIINIASSGRFHVLDLARELDSQGFDVAFYSFVPTKRALKFGLPKRCNKSLFYLMFPFLALYKITNIRFINKLCIIIQDYLTAWIMRPCDIFIAMSGNYVYSLQYAKNKYNAKKILERGSKHILEQKKILENNPFLKKTKPVSDFNVHRELKGYEIADYISVASQHVVRSFIERGYPQEKIFVNPYGVDLSDFYPLKNDKKYDAIMVGCWCYRKGCDILTEAILSLNLKLLHIGEIGDVVFPTNKQITHIDSVDQKQLINYYSQAKIFILPSREEGLALVQPQALACGLPIVCSMHTGGIDIANLTGMKKWFFEMKEYSIESLKSEILKAIKFSESCNPSELDIHNLLWKSYGDRYGEFIKEIVNG